MISTRARARARGVSDRGDVDYRDSRLTAAVWTLPWTASGRPRDDHTLPRWVHIAALIPHQLVERLRRNQQQGIYTYPDPVAGAVAGSRAPAVRPASAATLDAAEAPIASARGCRTAQRAALHPEPPGGEGGSARAAPSHVSRPTAATDRRAAGAAFWAGSAGPGAAKGEGATSGRAGSGPGSMPGPDPPTTGTSGGGRATRAAGGTIDSKPLTCSVG